MSSQKGNVKRTRKQKFQNSHAFKNDLHDKSGKIKMINNLTLEGLCQRCTEIIEWKIKYKKYKPLTQPATCVVCHKKTVKRAYYTVCQPCAEKREVCAKCNSKKEIVIEAGLSEREQQEQDHLQDFALRQLSERLRRTAVRKLEKGEDVTLPTGFGADEFFDDGDYPSDDEQDNSDESDGEYDSD